MEYQIVFSGSLNMTRTTFRNFDEMFLLELVWRYVQGRADKRNEIRNMANDIVCSGFAHFLGSILFRFVRAMADFEFPWNRVSVPFTRMRYS